MSRADDREVTAVDGCDLGDPQALGRGDDRRIDRAQWQVAVARDELGDPEPVRGRDGFNGECATRDVAEEADLGFGAEASREQVDDLGDDQGWHDQWAGMSLEQVEGRRVLGVVGVDIGIQRSGVDDESAYRGTSGMSAGGVVPQERGLHGRHDIRGGGVHFCPLLVLGIWWRGLTTACAFAGLIVGGGACVGALVVWVVPGIPAGSIESVLGQPAVVSVPASFLRMIVVSLLTRGSVTPRPDAVLAQLHPPSPARRVGAGH